MIIATEAVGRGVETGPCEELTTRTGLKLRVRPATPADKDALAQLFDEVSSEDRRFRFLSAVRRVDDDMLRRLTEVDHNSTEDFLAFDGERLVASAMVAADPTGERAEVAISVDAEYKHRGIGWALLDHVARYAASKGVKLIESIESLANVEAITLEREMGFEASPYPGDSTLVLLQRRID